LVNLRLNSSPVSFKIDTGAAVTAVPESMREYMGKVFPSSKILKGAGNHRLKVTGQAEATLGSSDSHIKETIYLVENLITPLLGKPAISKLGLIKFAGSMDVEAPKN
jgi:hypothetical protein